MLWPDGGETGAAADLAAWTGAAGASGRPWGPRPPRLRRRFLPGLTSPGWAAAPAATGRDGKAGETLCTTADEASDDRLRRRRLRLRTGPSGASRSGCRDACGSIATASKAETATPEWFGAPFLALPRRRDPPPLRLPVHAPSLGGLEPRSGSVTELFRCTAQGPDGHAAGAMFDFRWENNISARRFSQTVFGVPANGGPRRLHPRRRGRTTGHPKHAPARAKEHSTADHFFSKQLFASARLLFISPPHRRVAQAATHCWGIVQR